MSANFGLGTLRYCTAAWGARHLKRRRDVPICHGMHPNPNLIEDLPPLYVERRRCRDRRTEWRGGRRDADWTGRPPGALTRIEANRFAAWQRWWGRQARIT